MINGARRYLQQEPRGRPFLLRDALKFPFAMLVMNS
jgi:hypothetical protein